MRLGAFSASRMACVQHGMKGENNNLPMHTNTSKKYKQYLCAQGLVALELLSPLHGLLHHLLSRELCNKRRSV
jgi:hypothetical protein